MCDYNRFKDCIATLKDWFDSDKNSCVLKQVQMLIFETLIFKCVLKARAIAPKDEKDKIKLNGYLHWFIDKYYFQNQAIAIRRLVDAKKGSVSLRKIIEHLKKNKELFTRSNYCKYQNIPFDYSDLMLKEQEYISKNLKLGEAIEIPSEIDPFPSKDFHVAFDELSGVDAQSRSPRDIVSEKVFKKLTNDLDQCLELSKKASQTIAHTSIDTYNNPPTISYGDIQDAHKILCGISHFIGLNFLGRISYSMFIQPSLSWLKYISEPLIDREYTKELGKVRENYQAEINEWGSAYSNF